MLYIGFSFVFSVFIQYISLLSIFILFYRQQSLIFTKIWCVLFYFIVQCLMLGYFGEDFFIVLIVVAELPIFFCFFFFFITKTQLSGFLETNDTTINKSSLYLAPIILLLVWYLYHSTNFDGQFSYFLPESLNYVPQRSDFFLYYFSFFVASPGIVLFIGLLITAVTLVLLLFTFKNQIGSLLNIKSAKHVAWVRTQESSTQVNHPKVFTFFKI